MKSINQLERELSNGESLTYLVTEQARSYQIHKGYRQYISHITMSLINHNADVRLRDSYVNLFRKIAFSTGNKETELVK